MDCTQQSQFDVDESSNLSPTNSALTPPLSPPAPLPWGRLLPSLPSPSHRPVDLVAGQSEYWLGRSSTKCDIPLPVGVGLTKKEKAVMTWAHSMISNRHCKISIVSNQHTTNAQMSASSASSSNTPQPQSSRQTPTSELPASASSSISPQAIQVVLEDSSGNGTIVNQSTHLRKGHQRLLHSGDEICLVNPETLRKRIKSNRILQTVLQQYTYIFVLTKKPRRPCVNPRAMNYHGNASAMSNANQPRASSPRSARRVEVFYDIREVLGDGTSGQVRRAIHRQTGQEYAVKVISLRRRVDLTSMEHEVSMMQSLDHPYIIQLVDVFVHHGIAMYLVMELVSGGDLFDSIVQQERYSEVDARRVMRRLLSAVYYLHETKNMVHRDLKPENILCSSPTHVKLADFGLAKIIQSDGLKTFCGTPQYFAPEVLQRRTTVAGSGRYGKPADVWSLGVILYILLTGRPPFGADLDPMKAYLNALEFDDPVWKAMPQAQDLVQQMLRLDPKRRITVRQACDHVWINWEDGDTHVHPLDDPAVTARKRLFPEQSISSTDRVERDIGEEEESKSVVSKEDFAAAATSHQRHESVVFQPKLGAGANPKSDEPPTLPESKEEHESDQGTTIKRNIASPSSSKDSMSIDEAVDDKLLASTSPDKSSGDKAAETSELVPSPSSKEAATTSPEASSSVPLGRELSVTPSDSSDAEVTSRSPLSAMNLNQRSNRFRMQVLGREQAQLDQILDASNSSPSPSAVRSRMGTNQAAVTPNVSNVHRSAPKGELSPLPTEKAQEQDEEQADDPILSQFSSEPSSLGSFPESPKTKQSKHTKISEEEAGLSSQNRTKRTLSGKARVAIGSPSRKKQKKTGQSTTEDEDGEEASDSHDAAEAKHQQLAKSTRQTLLSAWFAPKNQKVQSN